jgi:3-oxoadipate enol-lactonase
MSIPVNLYHSEQGSGLPLILLHGFPLSSAIWREQQNRLSDQYRVITPDLRGHGRSPVTDEVYAMDLLAADVLALLDAQELDQVVLMGHSMGGYVALALAKLAPQRIKAFGLLGAHAYADTEEARQARYAMIEQVRAYGNPPVVEAMSSRLFAPIEHEDTTIMEHVNSVMGGTKTLGLVGALEGMAARPDTTTVLAGLAVPVLLIAGDQDAIVPIERIESLATLPANCTLVTIENAGHMMMMEQPQATAMAIRQFIEDAFGHAAREARGDYEQ